MLCFLFMQFAAASAPVNTPPTLGQLQQDRFRDNLIDAIVNDNSKELSKLLQGTKDNPFELSLIAAKYTFPIYVPNKRGLVQADLLGLSAFHGSKECAKFIIDQGFDINNQDPVMLPIEIAVRSGKKDIVSLLFEHGARKDHFIMDDLERIALSFNPESISREDARNYIEIALLIRKKAGLDTKFLDDLLSRYQ